MKKPLIRTCMHIAAGLMAASLAQAARADAPYVFTDLGTLPGYGFSTAVDINNSANVAGISFNIANGVQTARAGWIWTPNGTLQGFRPSDGYGFVQLRAINDVGEVAGWRYNVNAAQQIVGSSAFTWSPSSGLRTLQSGPTAVSTQANGLNDQGQVIGQWSSATQTHAALWNSGGQLTTLPSTPNGTFAAGVAINNAGTALVYGGDNQDYRGYLWTPGAGYSQLTTPDGYSYGFGNGINQAGNVAGYGTNSYSDLGNAHAMLWTYPGGVIDLGTLDGARYSLGRAVNNLGAVVGVAGDGSVATRGFLWTADGGMRDLRSLLDPADPVFDQFQAVVANDINDAGQIVGTFTTGGVRHAYLLTPVPQPAAIWLMLAGGAMLSLRRLLSQARRRHERFHTVSPRTRPKRSRWLSAAIGTPRAA